MKSEVHAFPAKRFFVEMLTRDIDLEAAILDLLDNCVDGCVRTGKTTSSTKDKPYAGYSASININKDYFEIIDNCGGIEKDLAQNYAFRFGRKDSDRDKGLHTVGVYGIGMKRAIFKLGTECTIVSNHKNSGFSIKIDEDWINDDDNWLLDMEDHESKEPRGTSIRVNKLHNSISIAFDEEKNNFATNLRQRLQKHYSLIIDKGFKVTINNIEVKAKKLQTMLDPSAFENERGISPQIYQTDYDGVKIHLIFGLYEKLPSDQDVEDIENGNRTKEDAGWTIICNDRVVVDSDKTHITGWGESPVPHFHTQYLALCGYVSFSADDASKLPVTTTKRGIDLDSALYASIKEEMKLATKTFTSFTNSWKGQSPERTAIQADARHIDVAEVSVKIPEEKWTDVKRSTGGKRYTPSLPLVPRKRTHARIQFTKHVDEISLVREFVCEDTNATPADVGIAAFDFVLAQASE